MGLAGGGSLAMVSWYLIERACFSLISALSRSPTMRWVVLAFDGRSHDLVEGGLHAVELELAHEVEELGFNASTSPAKE
jgi:hypothetical protein